ncbi:dihydrofolate reductase family protein [Virgibacillus salinus]|uniref:Dihydrofolate reductase n=1 Tax=Virgibacillus salinus TaxID=553311 RepID=A0A1H0XW68_9BACI|nr:dihydrofolate reductase family protein [Virgibacillus salinus]SDQ07147.1 Dihydrofolate reductase [Virgibacillus salinus]
MTNNSTKSKVVFDISMSLDGFIAASNRSADEPMGAGGERLHGWVMDDEDSRNRKLLEEAGNGLGAVITGRVTYDDSLRWWGANGPTGPARIPVFVLTHQTPENVPENSVYTYVNGIESALEQAKKAANGKVVSVMGGADTAQQFIAAGLVDEISIHLVPVLFGEGIPLFEKLRDEHIQLEPVTIMDTSKATHLQYRVLK